MSERNANTPRTATIENPMIVTSSFLCFLLKHELQIGFARSDEKYIHEPHMKYDLEARLRIDRAQGLHKLMLHVLHRVISSNEVSFLQREHCNSPAAGMLELLPRKDLNVLRTPPISGTPYRLRPGLRTGAHWASVSHTTRLLFTNRWNGHATSLHHR